MMPGNNDAPESVGEDTPDAATDNAATADHTASKADPSQPVTDQVADSDRGQAHAQSDAAADALNAAGAGIDDPLGFGDQRMDTDAEDAVQTQSGEDSPDDLQSRLQQAEAKATEHWDRLLRLQAEMENQRKRAQNDVNKARKFALESIVSDLLPVKDSLEMGLAAASAEDADSTSIIEGAELTLKMLAQVFEKNNILEVNPLDEKFDPEFHQAMSMQEVEGKDANSVISVMQKGYTLNERLVRPALVMVAK
jgi:molecular chaperone GrpE